MKSFIYYGLFVGIAILVLSSCRSVGPPRKRSYPVNYVEKNVFVNGEQYNKDTINKQNHSRDSLVGMKER